MTSIKDTGAAAFSSDFRFSNGTNNTYTYTYDAGRTTTDYTGNLVLENETRSRLLFDGGYVSLSDNAYHFFLTDHLGYVRVVANTSGTAEEYNHYYPLGGPIAQYSSSTSLQPIKFQGKEWGAGKGLDLYDFGARRYDPATGRWLSQDPLAEKYYSHSPYLFCAANPMRYVDPEGEDWFQNTSTGELYYNQNYSILQLGKGYMKGSSDWTYLAKNNSFSIPDSELIQKSSTPVFHGGFSFDKDSAVDMMKQVGYESRPLEALVAVNERKEYFSEGQNEICIPHRDEELREITKSAYIPSSYSQSVHHATIVGSIKREVSFSLPKATTEQWMEYQYYTYEKAPSHKNDILRDVFWEILKTFAQTR